MSELLKSIQKWLKRNRVTEEKRSEENGEKRERHFYSGRGEQAVPKDKGPHCTYCEGSHWGDSCPSYSTVENRKKFLAEKKLCFNCTRAGHQANQCRSSGCLKCKGKHHTSICTQDNGSSSDQGQPRRVLNGYTPSVEESLPAIIPLNIKGITKWAFLDTGSGRNFISSDASRKLSLTPVKHEAHNLVTVNGTKKQSMPVYNVEIESLNSEAHETIEVSGSSLPDFTSIKRPTVKKLKEKFPHACGKTIY